MGETRLPLWLHPLLSATFFNICPRHKAAPKCECNMFCLNCMKNAFCSYCRSSDHKDHSVVQIRRSSYHNVVRVAEISKLLDIRGVQTYIINSAKVIFLNPRPPQKGSSTDKGAPHSCEICGRNLFDPIRFCSLGCKLISMKKYGGVNFILNGKEEVIEEANERMARRLPLKDKEELQEGSQKDMHTTGSRPPPPPPLPPLPTPPLPTHSNSKRRKGIPHRASFGTIYN